MEVMDVDDDSTHEVFDSETSDDDVDYDVGAAFGSTTCKQSQSYEEEYQHEVLSTSSVVQYMSDIIHEVNHVLQLPPTTTRILLNHVNWDKEKLLKRFFDGDQEQLFREANVVNPFEEISSTAKSMKSPQDKGTEECAICLVVHDPGHMTSLECGHRVCNQCWKEHLTTKIVEDGVGQTIACASHNCPILVDDETVMRLVEDESVKIKYQHLITNNFVNCNRLLRWCPSPGCNNAIKVADVEFKPVVCSCGQSFCFMCGENWHYPVNCTFLAKWKDDSNFLPNTKECPKCKVSIEKNGGCKYITCPNPSCQMHFCWMCLGPWEIHTISYNCNKFEGVKGADHRDSGARYLFYWNRYMNHRRSVEYEHKLYSSMKDKMVEVQEDKMGSMQFLKDAVDILCKCRQTVMYTYVFAYYLEKNNQSEIFEDNQRNLVTATEFLSEYLQRHVTQENLADIKLNVQDRYAYCERRRRTLLDHVQDGYEEDWWEYNEALGTAMRLFNLEIVPVF